MGRLVQHCGYLLILRDTSYARSSPLVAWMRDEYYFSIPVLSSLADAAAGRGFYDDGVAYLHARLVG